MNDIILNINIGDNPRLGELITKFAINFIFAFIIIRFIYFHKNKNTQYLFTFLSFNVVIFFVTYLLSDVDIEIGFAFGLFAVFSILRYRTEQIPIKEMTFLFISITVAVINALINHSNSTTAEILFANVIITLITFILELFYLKRNLESQVITYEKIELIKPDLEEDLIKDLEWRTGLEINKFVITKIDFLNNTAQIKIFYEI